MTPAPARPAGYSGTPLAKKLGVKEGSSLGLIQAPPRFEGLLAPLPAGVTIRRAPRSVCDTLVWFVRARSELEGRFSIVTERVAPSGLWIAWPKLASGVQSDLREQVVREFALARGWVDFKICAVDETWSGLKFARRKPQG